MQFVSVVTMSALDSYGLASSTMDYFNRTSGFSKPIDTTIPSFKVGGPPTSSYTPSFNPYTAANGTYGTMGPSFVDRVFGSTNTTYTPPTSAVIVHDKFIEYRNESGHDRVVNKTTGQVTSVLR